MNFTYDLPNKDYGVKMSLSKEDIDRLNKKIIEDEGVKRPLPNCGSSVMPPGSINPINISKIDISSELGEELERMHDIINKNGGSANKEMRQWAMDKIEIIYNALFTARWVAK